MSKPSGGHSPRNPSWLNNGIGIAPRIKWYFGTDGPLASLAHSRETGDVFVSDGAGGLSRIDRRGRIGSMTRLKNPAQFINWSSEGAQGVLLTEKNVVLRFDRQLKVIHKITLPDECLCLAISPYGNHFAVSFSSGVVLIYDERKKRIAKFETIRPLTHLTFSLTKPLIYGAADQGLVVCHDLKGQEVWQHQSWTNVGDLKVTGVDETLHLANYSHGVQMLDADGNSLGSYILEGTVNHLDVSFEPQRLIVSTLEKALCWVDSDGQLLWMSRVNDSVAELICDPLGEWALCGFTQEGIFHMSWGG